MRVNGNGSRGVERVIAASENARSLMEFLSTTLAGLEEHLGYGESAFTLTLVDHRRVFAGAKQGGPEYVMEEYLERWTDRDALATEAARLSYVRRGWSTISGIYRDLDAPHRTFVDEFLTRTHNAGQLSVRIPGHASEGYLTVMRQHDFEVSDRELLLQLVPRLSEGLRRWLPVGLEAHDGLSCRERQVAELIAVGFNNREIGDLLHVEEDTVKKHVSHALARLEVRTRTELAVAWTTGRRLELAASARSR